MNTRPQPDLDRPANTQAAAADHDAQPASPDALPSPVDAAILRALRQSPPVTVPPGFAAGVAARAVLQPRPTRSQWAGFGPRIALASAVLLTVAMFAFAPHATPSFTDLRFDLELLSLAELGGLACCFGLLAARS